MNKEPKPAGRLWREENGVIYFSVTSDGTTGEGWIKRLENNGSQIEDLAKQALCSPNFKPTIGVTTKVVVLKGMLFHDSDRITEKIYVEADKRKFSKPNPELVCLIRDKFTDEEIEAMGLVWIMVMEPITYSTDNLLFLAVTCLGGGSFIKGCPANKPRLGWRRDGGFAFAAQQSCEIG